jgi:cell division protein ZapA
MPSVEVFILGQKYSLKGEEPREHLENLSRFIEERVKEVCDTYPNITPTKALILTIFTMADELHKLKLEHEDIARNLERRAAALSGLLD